MIEAFDEFMQAFEAFKEANDARLQALEAKRNPDVLIEKKLMRIETDLRKHDAQILSVKRPSLAHASFDPTSGETKAAMESYIRKGKTEPMTSCNARV